jgi:hypothetical protein
MVSCYSQNIIWIYYITCNRMGASGLTEMYSYQDKNADLQDCMDILHLISGGN